MKNLLGETVIVVGVHSSGGANHPAIVTRVFDALGTDKEVKARVNLTVFTDGMAPTLRASIAYYDSLQKANEVKANMPFCYPRG